MNKVKVVRFNSKGDARVGFIVPEESCSDLVFMDEILSPKTIQAIEADVNAALQTKNKKRV